MRLGIFGGTFNPVHCGHIELAREFISLAKLDKLLLIPAKVPPHKSSLGVAGEEHRLNMCRLASDGIDEIEVSDIELRRQGTSYTIDTLRELRNIYKDAEFYLVVGADMFVRFDEWRQWRSIFEECVICTAARNDDGTDKIKKAAEKFGLPEGKLIVTTEKIMTVSSTEIRRKIKNGESADGLSPEKVLSYIKENGLYL